MIILISGASHTGKTILAQKLLEKYQFPYLSIDLLKMGLIRSGSTSLTPFDDNELTDYLWNYIPFDWKKDFSTEYLRYIRYCCLVMGETYLKNHFDSVINFSGIIEKRLDDSDFTLEKALNDNYFYLQKCTEYGLDYILINDEYSVDFTL